MEQFQKVSGKVRESPFLYYLVAWKLRKRGDETEVQTSQPVVCLLG